MGLFHASSDCMVLIKRIPTIEFRGRVPFLLRTAIAPNRSAHNKVKTPVTIGIHSAIVGSYSSLLVLRFFPLPTQPFDGVVGSPILPCETASCFLKERLPFRRREADNNADDLSISPQGGPDQIWNYRACDSHSL